MAKGDPGVEGRGDPARGHGRRPRHPAPRAVAAPDHVPRRQAVRVLDHRRHGHGHAGPRPADLRHVRSLRRPHHEDGVGAGLAGVHAPIRRRRFPEHAGLPRLHRRSPASRLRDRAARRARRQQPPRRHRAGPGRVQGDPRPGPADARQPLAQPGQPLLGRRAVVLRSVRLDLLQHEPARVLGPGTRFAVFLGRPRQSPHPLRQPVHLRRHQPAEGQPALSGTRSPTSRT